MSSNPDSTSSSGRRAPRPVTQKRLNNIALYYVERFASTAENLRQVLERRVLKASYHHPTDREEASAWINDIVTRFTELGLVNDEAFAIARARNLLNKGKSLSFIRQALAQKGVQPQDIELTLAALQDEAPDTNLNLQAAERLAKRKKLGPHRPPPIAGEEPSKEEEQATHKKDLATLARAGFSYDVARRVLEKAEEE